jgi:hypothetical protein
MIKIFFTVGFMILSSPLLGTEENTIPGDPDLETSSVAEILASLNPQDK